jgi:translation elongation factor EF-1beta
VFSCKMHYISKLLRALSAKQKIKEDVIVALFADATIPSTLKSRVALYGKGDKRISVEKLKADVKACKKKLLKGGNIGRQVFFFGVNHVQVELIAQDRDEHNETFEQHIMKMKEPIKASKAALPYDENVPLGQGSYAVVYPMKVRSNEAIKIFKQDVLPKHAIDEVKECIHEFYHYVLSHNPEVVYKTSFLPNTNEDNIWIDLSDGSSGYVMRLLSGSLNSKPSEVNINKIAQLFQLPSHIPKKWFMHCDVKLENILHDGFVSTNYYLHDFDGVIVYDTYTMLPVSHVSNTKYTRKFFMTPADCHPVIAWYYTILNTRRIRDTDHLIEVMRSDVDNCLKPWNIFLAAVKSQMPRNQENLVDTHANAVLYGILDAYNGQPSSYNTALLRNMYQEHIKQVFARENDNDSVRLWLLSHLMNSDMYSAGASMVCSHVLRPTEVSSSIYDNGMKLIFTAMKRFIVGFNGGSPYFESSRSAVPYAFRRDRVQYKPNSYATAPQNVEPSIMRAVLYKDGNMSFMDFAKTFNIQDDPEFKHWLESLSTF